jgi:polysaccharide biosynthesis protein PslH
MAGKKICIVSHIPADPRGGGNGARIFSLTRQMQALGHSVHFAFLPSRQSPHFDADHHLQTFGEGALHVLTRGGVWSQAAYYGRRAMAKAHRRLLSAVGSPNSYYHSLDELFPRVMDDQLRRLHAAESFDAVVVVYVFLSRALLDFPGALRILDTHDRMTDRHLLFEEAGLDTAGYTVPEAVEAQGLRRADVVLAIQDEEADAFRRQLGPEAGRVHTVSHTLDRSRRVDAAVANAATFLGSSFTANIHAAQFYLREVLPRIHARQPAFTTYFAGSICQDVPDAPGIVKLGKVPHTSDAFAQGPICLNPILIGTGINIKLLDAMAAGVPAVSTETGVRGLPDRFRGSVITAPDDDPQAFADAVLSLAGDEGRRRSLAAVAAKLGETWNAEQQAALTAVLEAPRIAR